MKAAGRPGRVLLGVLVLLVSGCGAGGASGSGRTSTALGTHVEDLAGGRLAALPSGTLFMRVIRFVQPPHSSFRSKKHQPGFVFQDQGRQVLALAGGPTVTIRAGEAYFHQSVPHTHTNPTPGTSSWLFVAMWPSAARAQPNVNPLADVVYDSPDLTPVPATGAYSESLQLVSVDRGGHTATTQRSGMQLLYVLSGRLTVSVAGQTRVLEPGSGTYVAPRGKVQLRAAGGPVRCLDFTVTPVGQPFEVRPEA